ncbi:hypothetical protein LY78DRAFT_659813 [Colletotrichum sublineola]|nr:hypothetical protein LY78DRAFT_659813 [Colletotrichum sublineola]
MSAEIAAAGLAPLSEADRNRIRAPNTTTTLPLYIEKPPAPRSRKRKSDADADAAGPATKKKQATKKDDDPLPDLSGIHLDGDEDMTVPVYDTCDDVRTKISALLRRPGVTKAAFLRAIVKAAYPAGSDHKIAPNLLTNFLSKKGPSAGNTSSVFYAAYVFFEKLRVRDGKPKTKKREEMETQWPNGFETKELLGGGWVTAHVSERVGTDKFGKTVISGPRGVIRC